MRQEYVPEGDSYYEIESQSSGLYTDANISEDILIKGLRRLMGSAGPKYEEESHTTKR